MKGSDLISMLVFLGVNGVQDLRKREIFLIPTLLYGFFLVWQFLLEGESAGELLVSCIPGILLLAMSLTVEGSVGLGDVWVLLVMGIRLGLFLTLGILWTALLLIGCFFFLFLHVRGKDRKQDRKQNQKKIVLPLVPFLFLAMLIWGIIWII
ncbi:MAG: hypothetical protein MJ117_07135 [Lachnospiraceae bacterium]|nr:hypothetical protein [Lachnospiraceae bacterium]